jgi:bacillithiol biosynthesis deacetylase BshB1
MMKLDILAFGAHPDDVELGAGGTLAKHVALGLKTGIIDLTRGELGTRGSVLERNEEAERASTILGNSIRENLDLPDGFFENNPQNQLKVIRKIRQYQPDIILCNAPYDRHPDHGKGGDLVADAAFYSGLTKIETELNGIPQKSWRPRLILHYIQFLPLQPTLALDITGYIDQKIESVLAFKSQFYNPNSKEPETIISSKGFLESVRYRAQDLGRVIGTEYAEGFILNRLIGLNDLNSIL